LEKVKIGRYSHKKNHFSRKNLTFFVFYDKIYTGEREETREILYLKRQGRTTLGKYLALYGPPKRASKRIYQAL